MRTTSLNSPHRALAAGILYPVTLTSQPVTHGWFYRRIVLPILALLRMGASPERLAWSLAIGLLIGINPLLGSTTILCMAVALVCRLNIAASQIANHVAYPFQLLFVLPLLRMGTLLFHTGPIPFTPKSLFLEARHHPLALIRQLWMWEWHALVVWAALASVAIPTIAVALSPLLQRLLLRVEHHEYPVLPLAADVPHD